MLVLVPTDVDSNPLYKELVLQAHELKLDIRFTPVDEQRYETWVQSKDQARHTITLLGGVVGARDIAQVSQILASYKLNILRITRISGRRSLTTPLDRCRTAIALSVRCDVPNITRVRAELMHVAHESELDIAMQAENVYRRYRRLTRFAKPPPMAVRITEVLPLRELKEAWN
jgi:phosphoserine phosphatase